MRFFRVIEVPDPENLIGFDPAFHFAVAYDIEKEIDKTHPRGLSGCGVWRVNYDRSAGGIEMPSPVLLGIENAYYESRKCLKVTTIDRVVGLLL